MYFHVAVKLGAATARNIAQIHVYCTICEHYSGESAKQYGYLSYHATMHCHVGSAAVSQVSCHLT